MIVIPIKLPSPEDVDDDDAVDDGDDDADNEQEDDVLSFDA